MSSGTTLGLTHQRFWLLQVVCKFFIHSCQSSSLVCLCLLTDCLCIPTVCLCLPTACLCLLMACLCLPTAACLCLPTACLCLPTACLCLPTACLCLPTACLCLLMVCLLFILQLDRLYLAIGQLRSEDMSRPLLWLSLRILCSIQTLHKHACLLPATCDEMMAALASLIR